MELLLPLVGVLTGQEASCLLTSMSQPPLPHAAELSQATPIPVSTGIDAPLKSYRFRLILAWTKIKLRDKLKELKWTYSYELHTMYSCSRGEPILFTSRLGQSGSKAIPEALPV
uniref:Uncharacterized protein n=1 Tax=Oryza brachyantha TaxID=4533 RepID=J3N4H7_ORYBR